MPIRSANARWLGNFTDGSGTIRTSKGGYEGNYSAKSRFEEGEGTNPEELVGAAHAGCFSMFLAKLLADAGTPSTSIDTTARVHLEKTEAGPTVSRVELESVAQVPGISDADFLKLADNARDNCPISRLLAPGTNIILTARLA